MKTGLIYKLTCTTNGYFLYGSTTNSLNTRRSTYLSSLKIGYANTILQNCYNKYGKDSLVWKIVQSDVPEDIILFIEDIWMGANCSKAQDNKKGMNIRDASRPYYSDETKLKMSLDRKGIPNIAKRKTIYKYDLYGNFVEEIPYLKKFAEDNNYSPGNIQEAAKQRRDCAYGFMFRYEKFDKIAPIDKIRRGHIEILDKPIYQYSVSGELLNKYETLSQIEKSEFTLSKLVEYCGAAKTRIGFLFTYEEMTKEEILEFLKNPKIGKPFSNEHREKMRLNNLGKIMKKESKDKISNAFRGTIHPMAKLSLENIKEILINTNNLTNREFANKFKVDVSSIYYTQKKYFLDNELVIRKPK